MIVVDLGCYPHGRDVSIEPLVSRFSPEVLYGFDPLVGAPTTYVVGDTRVHLSPKVAWTINGYVRFVQNGLRSRAFESEAGTTPCFDLAEFIRALPADDIVLKLDVEGAEYQLLPHLCATQTDELLSLILVEWHCMECGRGGDNVEGCPDCGAPVAKIGGLRRPVEEWDPLAVAA
jgi:hypothetical protein